MTRKPKSGSRYVDDQVQRAVREYRELDPSILALTLTLYRTMGTFDRASQAEFGLHNLTPSLFNILTVLHRADDVVTMRQLSKAVSVRPTNLTSLVDALVKRGLVERVLNDADRRSFVVSITDAGEEFLARFLPGHWNYLRQLLGGLSQEDRAELTRLLNMMEQSVEDALRAGPPPAVEPKPPARGAPKLNGARPRTGPRTKSAKRPG
jgi:DNA-binding MarR family transcriptional regulator